MQVFCFTFNPFEENTYVLVNKDKECVIIDPGCYTVREEIQLSSFIEREGLKVVKLLNTHGHIDHIFGNQYVVSRYKVPFITHHKVVPELKAAEQYGKVFMGLDLVPSPMPDEFVEEGDIIRFGEEELEVLFTPGHSAGHISFYHRASQQLFSGDVLFLGSIGRTDLPGGSYPVLMKTIVEKVLPLGDGVRVYPGHGSTTVLGDERQVNPFIVDYLLGD